MNTKHNHISLGKIQTRYHIRLSDHTEWLVTELSLICGWDFGGLSVSDVGLIQTAVCYADVMVFRPRGSPTSPNRRPIHMEGRKINLWLKAVMTIVKPKADILPKDIYLLRDN